MADFKNAPSDTQLVKDYLDGDEVAFELLVERYASHIYNFLFRFAGEESADLTQEVFLKVWKNLKKFDPQKSFKTWIFAIARNTAIDWMRKKKHKSFSEFQSQSKTNETSLEENLPDLEPLPDAVFEEKELQKKLESALAQLPPDDIAIILLHHTEGLTFEEIAEVVNKPMNTVKSKYRRALIALRNHLL